MFTAPPGFPEHDDSFELLYYRDIMRDNQWVVTDAGALTDEGQALVIFGGALRISHYDGGSH